ncbi:MAG: serine/threonine-protein kinase [Aggregatilineales bacterium]
MSGTDPLIGKQLGDYLIQSVLGQGGMARVYKGYDSRLDRYAAVKVIEPTLTSSEEDEEYRERFQKEARAIARLNHPRVVGVYQFNNLDHVYYMAMVFVEGHDLRTVLKEYARQGKQLSHKQVLRIIGDIAQALDYSHSQGVIHRDIKPSNIMVTADGHAVLTDFGLALNATEGTIGNTFGSVHYIAPEQAMSSAQAVAQSDLYSLGVVLYEVLVGRVPFEDVSAMTVALKHISDPPPPPSTLNPKISRHVEEVVMKILDKDPQKRYASGRAFIYALEGAFATSNDEDTHDVDDKDVSRVSAASRRTATPPKSDSSHVAPLIMSPVQDSDRSQQDDVPTISDSSQAHPLRTGTQNALNKGGSRTGLIMGAVAALIILAIIAAVVILSGGGNDDEANANATGTAIALVAIEATEDATEEATEDANLTATAESVLADTQATETALALIEVTDVVEPTATIQPTETPEEPTATPTTEITQTTEPTSVPIVAGTPTFSTEILTQAEDAPEEILLRYDGRTLLLFNRSTQRLNITGLSFVRQSDNSTFRAREWSTSSNDLTSMRSEMCYQVLTTLYLDWDPEDSPRDICQFTQGFRQTSRSFWTIANVEEGALFEVRDNGVALGTCPVTEFESTDEVYCLIDIDPPEDGE